MATRTARWRAFADETIRRFAAGGELFERGLPYGPACSPHYGAAGIAYFLYRIAQVRRDPRLLDAAQVWSSRALRSEETPNAFWLDEWGIAPQGVGSLSMQHSAMGVAWVEALVKDALGNTEGVEAAVERFTATARSARSTQVDLALGWAGVGLSAALLLGRIDLSEGSAAAVTAAGRTACDRVLDALEEPAGRLTEPGMAHGYAGLLYALLRWSVVVGEPVPVAVRSRLNELAALGLRHHRGMSWPVRPGVHEYWAGWCRGSAGFVHLWITAARVLMEQDYLELAEGAASDTWNCRDRDLSDVCCGLAGQAYALEGLANVLDGPWRHRARELADRAARAAPSPPAIRHSLYRGDPGIALLLIELEDAGTTAMPLVDPL
jgi:eukaryotic-like serine/threonine-protein kinase